VEPSQFASKGKNTPLGGWTLPGRVLATIYAGEFVYQMDEVKA
jgi:dihydroorotase